jgi:hypothetical protein
VPALVAVQHDIGQLTAAARRGLRFRARGPRAALGLAALAALAWLAATLGHVALTGALPLWLQQPGWAGLGALNAALLLFLGGVAALVLLVYAGAALALLVARRGAALSAGSR